MEILDLWLHEALLNPAIVGAVLFVFGAALGLVVGRYVWPKPLIIHLPNLTEAARRRTLQELNRFARWRGVVVIEDGVKTDEPDAAEEPRDLQYPLFILDKDKETWRCVETKNTISLHDLQEGPWFHPGRWFAKQAEILNPGTKWAVDAVGQIYPIELNGKEVSNANRSS